MTRFSSQISSHERLIEGDPHVEQAHSDRLGDMKTAAIPATPLPLRSKFRLAACLPDFIALLKLRVMTHSIFTSFVGTMIAPDHLDPLVASVAVGPIAAGAGAAGALNM